MNWRRQRAPRKKNLMNNFRWAGLLALFLALIVFFDMHLGRYLTLASLASTQSHLMATIHTNPLMGATIFFFLYLIVAAFPLVPHIPMSLAAGALFGLWTGTVLASFASTIGATMAFLLTRHFFRERVERHYGERLESFQEGLQKNGVLFLLSLRMIPLVPFFLVNVLMGLTHLPTRSFYLVSQVGMLPATILFVNTGAVFGAMATQKAHLSPGTLVTFTLLGLFPWVARKTVRTLREGKIRKKFGKPRRFDRNIIVIGAGSAGLVAAYIAAAVKAKVTLIEASAMGGDCLNTGCVPSKALIRSAKFVHQVRKAAVLGVARAEISFDFKDILARVRTVIARVEPHDSRERYETMGVEVIQGQARITSPWTVEVDGRSLSTRSIIIAAGARPKVPDLPGLESVRWYTSDTIWSIPDLPQKLVILGGGPIGCELGQAFSRFGSSVTLVERGSHLLKKEDPDVSELLEKTLSDEGIEVLTGTRALRAEAGTDTQHLVWKKAVRRGAFPLTPSFCPWDAFPEPPDTALKRSESTSPRKERSRPTNGSRQTFPISMPVVMWPAPTSLPMPQPIRHGMPPSTPFLAVSSSFVPTTVLFLGAPSPIQRWLGSGFANRRPVKRRPLTNSPGLSFENLTGPLPTLPNRDLSRFSRFQEVTEFWA